MSRNTLEEHKKSARSAAFSHDNTVRICSTATGALQQTLEGHEDYVTSVAFSHDSKFVVSASASDQTVKIWSTETGATQQTLKGQTGAVRSVAFSHDAKLVASASYDRTVKIWSTKPAHYDKRSKAVPITPARPHSCTIPSSWPQHQTIGLSRSGWRRQASYNSQSASKYILNTWLSTKKARYIA